MWNALYAFEDPAQADAGMRALDAAGLADSAVQVHRRASGPRDGAAERIDEQVTGGVLSNLLNLFQGVFDWGASPHDAAHYEAVINRGGVVIELRAEEAQRDALDALLAPKADRHTGWREVA